MTRNGNIKLISNKSFKNYEKKITMCKNQVVISTHRYYIAESIHSVRKPVKQQEKLGIMCN